MAQGTRLREPIINKKMKELDIIKVKYDNSSEKEKLIVKTEWDKKVDDIAATIRQLCGKNKTL